MTNEQLTKANELKEEIRELDRFIYNAERVWTGSIIRRGLRMFFQAHGYGVFSTAEFKLKTPIKNRVLDVLRDHLKELKKEMEDL